MVESEYVLGLRKELEVYEKELSELVNEMDPIISDPSKAEIVKELKVQIKEKKKIIGHHKELIMILGDEDFNYEHGDVFDRLFTLKGESVNNPVAGIRFPFGGMGMAIFLELREFYYKWRSKKEE